MRSFSYFRPGDPVEITHGNLPHWDQPGVCYFLTFRSLDSIPAEVLSAWNEQRKQ